MRILFMGTPDFAVPALKALLDSPHEVAAVYTQPPRPAGRGQQEQKSPVQQLAEQHGIPVRTPATLKTPEIQQEFREWHADVAVVAAYGLLLPMPILEACRFGCINIHPSLLPRWRGAAPIQRTIMAGDTETAVAIMQMDKGLDTGDILSLKPIPLTGKETAKELHDQLSQEGAELLLHTLDQLGTLTPTKQTAEGVTYAAKLTKEEGIIDWQLPATALECRIRAFTPWPGASFRYQNENIKVLAAEVMATPSSAAPGTVLDDRLTIQCGEGALRPLLLQRPGRKAMPVEEFLRGFALPAGTSLTNS